MLGAAPGGDALLLRAEVIARGLASPLPGKGGALVVDRSLGPATGAFTPGSAGRLRSRDGRVQIDIPGRAAAMTLTLRQGSTPLAGARITFVDPIMNGAVVPTRPISAPAG